MCEKFGLRVVDLHRVQIGDIQIGDVPEGAWRLMSEREVRELRELDAALVMSPLVLGRFDAIDIARRLDSKSGLRQVAGHGGCSDTDGAARHGSGAGPGPHPARKRAAEGA